MQRAWDATAAAGCAAPHCPPPLPMLPPQLYEAVQHYSLAIRLAPWAPVLYTNRALALLQRGWGGDALCALRDAETGGAGRGAGGSAAAADGRGVRSELRPPLPCPCSPQLRAWLPLAPKRTTAACRRCGPQACSRCGAVWEGAAAAWLYPSCHWPCPADWPCVVCRAGRHDRHPAVQAAFPRQCGRCGGARGGGEWDHAGPRAGWLELNCLPGTWPMLPPLPAHSCAPQIAADMTRQAQQAELRRQQMEQRRQLRRRRGMQFDRERRERRQQQQQQAATAGQAGGAAPGAGEAAGTAPSPGAAAASAGPAGPSVGSPARAASEPPAGSSSGGEGEAAAEPEQRADSWYDAYASDSDEEDEEGEEGGLAAAAAAAGSGIDAQYAAALEAAAGGGATAEEAAAAATAPSVDSLLAGPQPGSSKQAGRQPSLWHALEGGRRMLQVRPASGPGRRRSALARGALGCACLWGAGPLSQHALPSHRPRHLPPAALQRYVGQCNLQTDIKEACFLGADDALVAAGSDDGRVFIFKADTGECIRWATAGRRCEAGGAPVGRQGAAGRHGGACEPPTRCRALAHPAQGAHGG